MYIALSDTGEVIVRGLRRRKAVNFLIYHSCRKTSRPEPVRICEGDSATSRRVEIKRLWKGIEMNLRGGT